MKAYVKESFQPLPLASVLEKIKRLDPEGPEFIINWSENAQLGRHEEEKRQLERATQTIRTSPLTCLRALRNIFDAVSSLFGEKPKSLPVPKMSLEESLEDSWIRVGNDMRSAIESYFLLRPHVLEHIELTQEEEKSLQPLPVKPFATLRLHP